MDRKAFNLLLSVLLPLLISPTYAGAKEVCLGGVTVELKHADGTLELLNWGWYQTVELYDTSITLSPGESIRLSGERWSSCSGPANLDVHFAALGDTANWTSPEIGVGASTVELDQPGSYYALPSNVDFGFGARIFIAAPPHPCLVGLAFTLPYPHNQLVIVPPGDTCMAPCVTAYLQPGQSVQLRPNCGGLVPPGGHAVVRYAPEGDTVTFDTPATLIPLDEGGSYAFSADGSYLLSVEDSTFFTPAYAFARVSHLPFPRVDMSLTIERLDGSTEEFAYINPDHVPHLNVALDSGEVLRAEYHEITEPCGSVRLQVNRSDDWSPAGWWDTLLVDSLNPDAGIAIAEPGSYFLAEVTECGVQAAQARVTINAPDPQLDLVVSLRHGDGTETELFRTHALVFPPPHLEANLGPGDSVRVHVELIQGWCSMPLFQLRKSQGAGEASHLDPLSSYNGYSAFRDLTFRNGGRHLIELNQAFQDACFEDQDVFLDVNVFTGPPPPVHILFSVTRVPEFGPLEPVVMATSATPPTVVQVELATLDSLKVIPTFQGGYCTGTVLKGYRSGGDTATTLDPLFLDAPMMDSGVLFHATGILLLTVEDTCGAISAQALLHASEALSAGVSGGGQAGAQFQYADQLLRVHAEHGGLLVVRNTIGQVLQQVELAAGAGPVHVPVRRDARGLYIATLRGPAGLQVFRFVMQQP